MSAMPESPAFLAKMGKKDKARQSLQWLRGGDDGIGILLLAQMTTIDNNDHKPR